MTTYALHFPPYIPVTLKEHYFSDVPAPTAGDDGKALTYRHSLADYVYTSFEAAGAAASVAAAAATALATHASATSGVHGIAAFGATLNATASQGAAQTALGLVIGTNVQAQNENLAAIAGLTTAANKLEYWTGSGAAALADFTSYGRGLVASANVAATGLLAADGSVTGATGQAQTFTNGIVGPLWKPASDSTTALRMSNVAGTAFFTGNSTDGGVTVNTIASPAAAAFVVQKNGTDMFVVDARVATAVTIRKPSTAVGTELAIGLVLNGTTKAVLGIAPSVSAGVNGTAVGDGFWRGAQALLFSSDNGTTLSLILASNKVGIGNNTALTALADISASTTAAASLRIRNGTWPTTPNDGDIANDGNAMRFMLNGTNAVNTDGGLSIWMQSSATARNAGRLLWQYTDKTDATRKSEGAVTAFDGATEYKAIRWGANGAAMIGVLGAAPALRQVVTGSKTTGAALVSLLAALVTFGWITDSTTA